MNELLGRWRLVEMELWSRDATDLVEPAFIEFESDDRGRFGFIVVQGWMDCSYREVGGRPHVDFSWVGSDEGNEVSGRGWATLQPDGSLDGRIHFHMGDDSAFMAVPDSPVDGRKVDR